MSKVNSKTYSTNRASETKIKVVDKLFKLFLNIQTHCPKVVKEQHPARTILFKCLELEGRPCNIANCPRIKRK